MAKRTYSSYGIVFNTFGDAHLAQKDLLVIARAYGSASLAELKDNLKLKANCEDTRIRWSAEEINNARIFPNKGGCSIYLPACGNGDKTDDEAEDEAITEGESDHHVYVNITTTDMADSADILNSVFTNLESIRDRDIFVNIY